MLHAIPAGAVRRLGAFVVDSLAVGASVGLLDMLLGGAFTTTMTMSDPETGLMDVTTLSQTGFLFSLLLNWAYFAGLEASPLQGTAGKLLTGCMVVDKVGQRLSLGRATARWLAKFLSGIILGIGYLMILFRRDRCGLHDLVAGTQVIVGRV